MTPPSATLTRTQAPNEPSVTGLIDVRLIPPAQRHALIFDRLDALQAGESLHLASDHDPLPLLNQLERQRPGDFECAYLSAGPTLWQLELRRTANQAGGKANGGGSCCGGCCGA